MKNNKYGQASIQYYNILLKYIEEEINKQTEKVLDDFFTVITITLSIARLYSKLMYNEKKYKVEALVNSLNYYKKGFSSLKNSEFTKTNSSLMDQMRICEEMADLLPVKIGQISSS